MKNTAKFEAWPKFQRHALKSVVITEKMDGTNACIIIEQGEIVGVQSRKRIITPDDDNYGFAGWVERNEKDILKLGDGRHFGEWVGLGIQKNPHNLDAKYFYLFNTSRWSNPDDRPDCVRCVEVLYTGKYSESVVESTMENLNKSAEDKGYKAEGIVVYFPKFKVFEKHTFEYSEGKWSDK